MTVASAETAATETTTIAAGEAFAFADAAAVGVAPARPFEFVAL